MQKPDDTFLQMLIEHQAILHKISRAYCLSTPDQADLMQEMALQLWRSWPSFRRESKVSTWVYRVALNVALTYHRQHRISTNAITQQHFQIPEQNEPDSAETERLYQAMQVLTEVEKAVLMLYFEDYSFDEIAAMSGLTLNNVRVKMHRIREKLRTKIQSEHSHG
ncbi:MAG: sigma-70 family RNA polymerase sigma factor [Saprospiraceae bacterium]|nr:sigma-70 family RNA polymerase sigma factor [Saprospiraceae bacterium]